MKSKAIKKAIDIVSPKETVWNVLLNDKYTRLWYAEFSEGTYAETDWKVGSKALFRDSSDNGLIGKVVVNNPNITISVEYLGILNKGIEDYDSDLAKGIKGGLETYHLLETNGITNISVVCDTAEEMYAYMSSAWDKALLKIKKLSEGMATEKQLHIQN